MDLGVIATAVRSSDIGVLPMEKLAEVSLVRLTLFFS